MSNVLLNILQSGIEQLELSVRADIQQQLIDYIQLLQKWNKIYNLTAIKRPKDMVSMHLLDSLAILPHCSGQNILDVATGAGLPGIVLALCLPDTEFVLVDSKSKKTRFLNQVLLELSIKNVQIVHARIEDYHSETSFDCIVTRAYTGLQGFIKSTCHLANKNTVYLGMKAHVPDTEISDLDQTITVKIIPLQVPTVAAVRHLIIMTL